MTTSSSSQLCLCLLHLAAASAAPFMSSVFKQSLLKVSNETAGSTGSWDILEEFKNDNTTESPRTPEEVDLWSVMWYLGAFGGLVTFFLIVTCSEWCFGNHMYTRHGINQLYVNAYQSNFRDTRRVSNTPPPPYDLFAPPSYTELFGKEPDTKKKSKFDVFIIPIHGRSSSAAS